MATGWLDSGCLWALLWATEWLGTGWLGTGWLGTQRSEAPSGAASARSIQFKTQPIQFKTQPHWGLPIGRPQLPAVGHSATTCEFDFDGNGVCDLGDLDALLYHGVKTQDAGFDLNGDGAIGLADRNIWLAEFGTFAGDVDLDGRVNSRDLNGLALNWQTSDAMSYAQGDLNGDGSVNSSDLNELALKWQTSAEAATAVPEPKYGWIIGLLCVLGLRSGIGKA